MQIKKSLIFNPVFFILLIFTVQIKSQTITVTGANWTVPLPSITEAGSNYSGTYESSTNQIILAATVPLLLGNAKVTVHYEPNPNWNSALILSARRNGNGTTVCALCTITGGTTYLPFTQTAVELFRIQAVLALASYSNIPVQIQLSGVSVTIPAANYNSRIVFTISAL
nr:hypothetical protein [uncultured Chryseobacterium sp.]